MTYIQWITLALKSTAVAGSVQNSLHIMCQSHGTGPPCDLQCCQFLSEKVVCLQCLRKTMMFLPTGTTGAMDIITKGLSRSALNSHTSTQCTKPALDFLKPLFQPFDVQVPGLPSFMTGI